MWNAHKQIKNLKKQISKSTSVLCVSLLQTYPSARTREITKAIVAYFRQYEEYANGQEKYTNLSMLRNIRDKEETARPSQPEYRIVKQKLTDCNVSNCPTMISAGEEKAKLIQLYFQLIFDQTQKFDIVFDSSPVSVKSPSVIDMTKMCIESPLSLKSRVAHIRTKTLKIVANAYKANNT